MLSAITGLILADLSERLPIIDWRDGVYAPLGENAYPLLFKAPFPMHPESFQNERSVIPPVWQGKLDQDPSTMISRNDPNKHNSPLIYRKYCVDFDAVNAPQKIAVYWSYLPKFGRLRHLMRHDKRFVGRSISDISRAYLMRYFSARTEVETLVSLLMDRIPRPIIGLHIRYTDRKVPLKKIYSMVKRRLSEIPDASIYLATDSILVQKEISNRFPNVFYHKKRFSPSGEQLHLANGTFNKTTEAANALVDMIALSRCDHLIYSKNSTFAVVSALVGDFDNREQNDVDRLNIPVVFKRMIQSYI